MRIGKIERLIDRHPCTALVHIAEGRHTLTARIRIARAAKAALPPEQCGRRSDYLVNGAAMCLAHAGKAAIEILMHAQPAAGRTVEDRIVAALSDRREDWMPTQRLALAADTTVRTVKVVICRLRDQGFIIDSDLGRRGRGYRLLRSPGE